MWFCTYCRRGWARRLRWTFLAQPQWRIFRPAPSRQPAQCVDVDVIAIGPSGLCALSLGAPGSAPAVRCPEHSPRQCASYRKHSAGSPLQPALCPARPGAAGVCTASYGPPVPRNQWACAEAPVWCCPSYASPFLHGESPQWGACPCCVRRGGSVLCFWSPFCCRCCSGVALSRAFSSCSSGCCAYRGGCVLLLSRRASP